ncbi:MAG: MBOAT family protein [Eubacteriaceae bacterium]|nr:MBOAT family protein [Eubacteriaceae bacterium]
MVFSSIDFIFKFLPAVLIAYYIVPKKFQNAVIFLGSIVFYSVGALQQPYYILLFVATIAVNYILAIIMDSGPFSRTVPLIVGLVYDFGWLFLFKYADFILNTDLGLILPLGISFYTFQMVSYLVDVYRRDIKAEKSFIKFGAYVSMFVQLIAGPIVTYREVSSQLAKDRYFSFEDFAEGIRQFVLGLGLKVLIANQVGALWTQVGTIGYDSISTKLAWLGVVAYSFQLYFDFWGYSLMAIGLGKMLGIKIPKNFDHPYISLTMTEFWRRWHITLGSWFREYVYIPLGGNRVSVGRWIFNLFAVWSLTGLWHGAAWNFVLWGVVLFAILLIEKLFIGDFMNSHPAVGHVYMAFLIPLTWCIFAITDFSQLGIYFTRLFPFFGNGPVNVFAGDFMKNLLDFKYVLAAGVLFSTRLPVKLLEAVKTHYIEIPIYLAIFWGAVYCLYIGMNDPFLYFRF